MTERAVLLFIIGSRNCTTEIVARSIQLKCRYIVHRSSRYMISLLEVCRTREDCALYLNNAVVVDKA